MIIKTVFCNVDVLDISRKYVTYSVSMAIHYQNLFSTISVALHCRPFLNHFT